MIVIELNPFDGVCLGTFVSIIPGARATMPMPYTLPFRIVRLSRPSTCTCTKTSQIQPASTGLFLWDDEEDKAVMKGEKPFEFRCVRCVSLGYPPVGHQLFNKNQPTNPFRPPAPLG